MDVYGRYSYSYWGLYRFINKLISGGPHPVAIQEDDYICTSQTRKKMKQNNAFPAIPAITACFMASKKNAWGISSNFTIPGTPARPENPHFWVRLQHICWVREGHGEHLSETPRDKTMPRFLLHGGVADGRHVSLGAVDHPLYSITTWCLWDWL